MGTRPLGTIPSKNQTRCCCCCSIHNDFTQRAAEHRKTGAPAKRAGRRSTAQPPACLCNTLGPLCLWFGPTWLLGTRGRLLALDCLQRRRKKERLRSLCVRILAQPARGLLSRHPCCLTHTACTAQHRTSGRPQLAGSSRLRAAGNHWHTHSLASLPLAGRRSSRILTHPVDPPHKHERRAEADVPCTTKPASQQAQHSQARHSQEHSNQLSS